MNNLNEQGVFELNDEILPEIRSIALLNGWDYGRGVYAARAMMDSVIEFNMPEEGEKLGLTNEMKIIAFPNPCRDIVTLQHYNGIPATEIKSIEIFNLFGFSIKESSFTNNRIDISNFANGIYVLKVTDYQGKKYILNLEILR